MNKKNKSQKIFDLMCWPASLITHRYKLLNVLGIVLFIISSAVITLFTFPYLLYLILTESEQNENTK